jgi:hypothetical protein
LALNQQVGIPGVDQAPRVDQAAVMAVVTEMGNSCKRAEWRSFFDWVK